MKNLSSLNNDPETANDLDDATRAVILEALNRYTSLRFVDIRQLLASKGVDVSYETLVQIASEASNSAVFDLGDEQLAMLPTQARSNDRHQFVKNTSLRHASKRLMYLNLGPSAGRKRTPTVNRNLGAEGPSVAARIPQLSFTAETRTLVQDLHKAFIHQDLAALIRGNKSSRQPNWFHTDRLLPVMQAAVETERLKLSRPVLVHELADYPIPYMTRFSALRRLLARRCARTVGEKSVIGRVLRDDLHLNRLRSQAPAPPELYEPLAAFHGLTQFSADACNRLQQKLSSLEIAMDAFEDFDRRGTDVNDLLDALPENTDSAGLSKDFPFRHMFGFRSAVPTGVSGSVRMGAERTFLEKQLDVMRYPTLQRVAHDLPVDPAYRQSTVHAISVLERNRGWPFHQKLQFINSLKEVQANLAPSHHYATSLNLALPKLRQPFMINSRRASRPKGVDGAWVFLSPLRTIAMRKKLTKKKR